VDVDTGLTGGAVDKEGNVWSANYNDNSLSHIDPTLKSGVEQVDLNLQLGQRLFPQQSW
jgi:streptogramin lyase